MAQSGRHSDGTPTEEEKSTLLREKQKRYLDVHREKPVLLSFIDRSNLQIRYHKAETIILSFPLFYKIEQKLREARKRKKWLEDNLSRFQKDLEEVRECLTGCATVSTKDNPDAWGNCSISEKPYAKWEQLDEEEDEDEDDAA